MKNKNHNKNKNVTLPAVLVVEVSDLTLDGELMALPRSWDERKDGAKPQIAILPAEKGHPDFVPGDPLLVRLTTDKPPFVAEVIRPLDMPDNRMAGIVFAQGNKLRFKPAGKKDRFDFDLDAEKMPGLKNGDLVVARIIEAKGRKPNLAVPFKIIGHKDDINALSRLSVHERGLREEFPSAVVDSTADMTVPPLGDRTDLRDIKLVTIDGADAKDFDDAVFAEPWPQEQGHHIIVAIADVSYYVRPGTPLDEEARARGNSTYFPDRVVPMLPEKLSNDLCSLRPDEPRACFAVHLYIDGEGQLKNYKFIRGLMKSHARLTYEQAQGAHNGKGDPEVAHLKDSVIAPLYDAFQTLDRAREKRGTLDLDLPERKVMVGGDGKVKEIRETERLDSHRLIEEFMILANVAAARALAKAGAGGLYRVHDTPDPLKIQDLRQFAEAFGIDTGRAPVKQAGQMNQILRRSRELPLAHLFQDFVLRTQSQAHYSPENRGHFGLALEHYTHFTSPIRRYADLMVHRRLLEIYKLGEREELSALDHTTREEIAHAISQAERRSIEAERNSIDRFTAAWLHKQEGKEYKAIIRGVNKAGLFCMLKGNGADAFLPTRMLNDDYYTHIEEQHALVGKRTKKIYRLGAELTVRLKECDPLSGNIVVEPLDDEGADWPEDILKQAGLPKLKTGKPHKGGKGGKKFGNRDHKKGRRKKKGGGPHGKGDRK